jgi:predicted Zn-dependent protease
MSKKVELGTSLALYSLSCVLLAQSPTVLNTEDEIRAGHALVSSFQKANGVAETPESKSIEQYLQSIGDRIAKNASRKLPYKFHLDPNPAFRSAVAYPG